MPTPVAPTHRRTRFAALLALAWLALAACAQTPTTAPDPNDPNAAPTPTTTQAAVEQKAEAEVRQQSAEEAKKAATAELEEARRKQAEAEEALADPTTPSPTAEEMAAFDLNTQIASRKERIADLREEYAAALRNRADHELQIDQRIEQLRADTAAEALAQLSEADRTDKRATYVEQAEADRALAKQAFEAGDASANRVTDLLAEQQALLAGRDAAPDEAVRSAYNQALELLERQIDQRRLLGYERARKGRTFMRLANEYEAAVARIDAYENRFWIRNAWLIRVGWIILVAAATTVGVDVVGWLVSRATAFLVRRWRPGRALPTVKRTETLVQFARSILKLIIWVAATVTTLEQFGIQPGQSAGALGVIGLVLMGMFQHLVIDFVKGIDIALGGHYFVGDFIQVGNVSGHVLDFTVKYTMLRTPSGQVVLMPNSQCVPSRRFPAGFVDNYVDITLAPGSDVSRARDEIRRVGRLLNARIETLKQAPQITSEFTSGDATILRVMLRVLPTCDWVANDHFIPLLKQRFVEAGVELVREPTVLHINDVPTFRRLFSRHLDDKTIAAVKARDVQPTLVRDEEPPPPAPNRPA